MSIAQLDAAVAGEGPLRATGTIALGEMPGGHSIDVPFTVLRGRERDPVVWMMAARDGDEVHATLVAMDLQRRLSPEVINGAGARHGDGPAIRTGRLDRPQRRTRRVGVVQSVDRLGDSQSAYAHSRR